MKYKLVIFDLDGTLVDTSEGIIRCVNESLPLIGYSPCDEGLIKSCIGPPLSQSLIEKGVIGEEDGDFFIKKFRHIYEDKYLLNCKIYDGIEDLLEFNIENGIINTVATNKPEIISNRLLEKINIKTYFDYVIGTNNVEMLTKKDLIERCLTKTNVSVRDALMVGDTMNDYNAASSIKMDFIGVSYGFGLITNGNVVDSPMEIISYY